MPEQSSFHFQFEWAKERLGEMEAALARLEREAQQLEAGSAAKTEQVIADLRTRCDQYRQAMKGQMEAGASAWTRDKAQLESQWKGFADDINKNVEKLMQQVGVQQAVFRDLAAAQCKAWRATGDQLHGAADQFVAEQRKEIEGMAQQMKQEASVAEARLKQLAESGSRSWTALSGALAESRAAFDRAVEAAGAAFKHASEPGPRADNRPPH